MYFYDQHYMYDPVKDIDILLGWGMLSHDEFSEADTYLTWARTQVFSSESGPNSQ